MKVQFKKIGLLLLTICVLLGMLSAAAFAADGAAPGKLTKTQAIGNSRSMPETGAGPANAPHLILTSVTLFNFPVGLLTDTNTGRPAYCLDHDRHFPNPDTAALPMDPEKTFDSKTYRGLQALLFNGYPYDNGGLSNNVAQAYTQFAVWFWLKENGHAGLDYDAFLEYYQVDEQCRAYLAGMMEAARGQRIPVFRLSAEDPAMKRDGDKFKGKTTVSSSGLWGKYTVDESKIPDGVTVSGYTGSDGDVLTFTAPLSLSGKQVRMAGLFLGRSPHSALNLSFYDNVTEEQQRVVVTANTNPVAISAGVTMRFPGPADPTDPATPAGPTDPTDPAASQSGVPDSDPPQTGESSNLLVYMALFAAASAAIGLLILVNRHQKNGR